MTLSNLALLFPPGRARLRAGWSLLDGTWHAPFCIDGNPISERDWLIDGNPLPEHPEYRDFIDAAYFYEASDNDHP